jgi:hypothetical protein
MALCDILVCLDATAAGDGRLELALNLQGASDGRLRLAGAPRIGAWPAGVGLPPTVLGPVSPAIDQIEGGFPRNRFASICCASSWRRSGPSSSDVPSAFLLARLRVFAALWTLSLPRFDP